jgi:hypothetical protein
MPTRTAAWACHPSVGGGGGHGCLRRRRGTRRDKTGRAARTRLDKQAVAPGGGRGGRFPLTLPSPQGEGKLARRGRHPAPDLFWGVRVLVLQSAGGEVIVRVDGNRQSNR